MAILGAEARGLVRSGLSEIRKHSKAPLRFHIGSKMHDLAQKRFSKGRSLSEMELRAIKRETTEPALPHMRHPNWADPIKNNRLILYAEPTLAEIRSLKQASDPYEGAPQGLLHGRR